MPLLNRKLLSLVLLALLILATPLGLTYYAWQISSENAWQHAFDRFNTMALENEKALLHRIDTYDYALLGGTGFFQGSEKVSRQDWRDYVDKINVTKNFPGINGIGFAKAIPENQVNAFLAETRKDNAPHFKIHPETKDKTFYVTAYLEPENINRNAVGLNLAFEKNRRAAAEISRDIGRSTITHRIVLVQDEQRTPGFLLLQPLYKKKMPTGTLKERRDALMGWVFAPFIARNFMSNLTNSQGNQFCLEVYDGHKVSNDNLIYSDEKTNAANNAKPKFVITKKLNIKQRQWTLVWKSTKAYEQQNRTDNPLLILVGGVAFTGMLALFLLVYMIRNTRTMEIVSGENNLFLPVLIFIVTSIGSFYLYSELNKRELAYVRNLVNEEASKIQQMISYQANDKLLSLKRMAQRWESHQGTPQQEWRADAGNYIGQLPGLKALEWVDNSYHVRWIEPLEGNEKLVGLNVLYDKTRVEALQGAAERNAVTVTPPMDVLQGYKAFIAYAPLQPNKKFDGFMVGVFSVTDFVKNTISKEIMENYAVILEYQGREFYRSENENRSLRNRLEISKAFNIQDKEWIIRVIPTVNFVKSQRTTLPLIVFMAGLLIAALLSLTVRYILISRIRSNYLRASEETFRDAMEYASIGMALVSLDGKWLRVNQALCQSLGYTEEELLALDFQTLTHPDDLEKDLDFVHQMLRSEIESYHMEKRYFHKDGHIIWVLLSVSMARYADGRPKHFISQLQDITQQKEMDRIKGEFISIVSHELRTPLTSIRGSLGLIMGQ